MLVNIFIIEKLDCSKPIEEGLHTQLQGDYYMICLDAARNPQQFCRDYFYIMYVKPYFMNIPDYKYDPEEWTIKIININESLWSFIFVELDHL